MASKYVTDTSAASSISAYVILKKGEQVARVTAHFANSGSVLVNVNNYGQDAMQRSKAAYLADNPKEKDFGSASDDAFYFQHGRAHGGGYDKFTAALAGLYIDGNRMFDHCGRSAASEKLLKAYRRAVDAAGGKIGYQSDDQKAWSKKAAKIGASFANWGRDDTGYSSLHMASGLDLLTMRGYIVIQAI